jgi:hypothetical protein
MKTLALIIAILVNVAYTSQHRTVALKLAHYSKDVSVAKIGGKAHMSASYISKLGESRVKVLIDSLKAKSIVNARKVNKLKIDATSETMWCAIYDRHMIVCKFVVTFVQGTETASLVNFKHVRDRDLIIAESFVSDLKKLLEYYYMMGHEVKSYTVSDFASSYNRSSGENDEIVISVCANIVVDSTWENEYIDILSSYWKYMVYENGVVKSHIRNHINKSFPNIEFMDNGRKSHSGFDMYHKNTNNIPVLTIKAIDDNGKVIAVGHRGMWDKYSRKERIGSHPFRLFRETRYNPERDHLWVTEDNIKRHSVYNKHSVYERQDCQVLRMSNDDAMKFSSVKVSYKR